MACILHPLPMNNQLPPPYQPSHEPTFPAEDIDNVKAGPPSTKTNRKIGENKSSSNLPKLNFPAKLQLILSTPEFHDIICWLPHGRAWRVQQQDKLEKEILPKFFQHQKAASFYRQVTGWGFHRVISGSDFNAYYHELFLRDAPELCHKMKRPTRSQLAERKQGMPKTPPDFYVMPPVSEANNESLDPSFASQHMSSGEYKDMLVRRLSTYSINEKGMYLQLELNRLDKRRAEIQKQLEDLGEDSISEHQPTQPPTAVGLPSSRSSSLEAHQLLLGDLQSINGLQPMRSLTNIQSSSMPSMDRLQMARLQLLQQSLPESHQPRTVSQVTQLANLLLGPQLDGSMGFDRYNPFNL